MLFSRGNGLRMAKLYFTFAAMNAGKSSTLLQAAHNYKERGMNVMLWTFDRNEDEDLTYGYIQSRIGLKAKAHIFAQGTELFTAIKTAQKGSDLRVVFVDEAQFLSSKQVWQLAQIVDELKLPVLCYGLRTDFRGELFEGSASLLAIADEIREARTICHCGRRATMNLRKNDDGSTLKDGEQIRLEKNRYVSLCRKHWREAYYGDEKP